MTDKPDYQKSLELWIDDLRIWDEGTDQWSTWSFKKVGPPTVRNPPEQNGDPEQQTGSSLWTWFPCYPGECANHTGRWLELALECFRRWLASRSLRPVPPTVPDWSWYILAEENPALLLLDPALKFLWYWFIYPHIRTKRAFLGEGVFDPPLDPPWGDRPLDHYDRATWPFEDLGFGEGGQSVSAGRIEYLRCFVDTVTLGPWDPQDPASEAYLTGPFFWPIRGTSGFGIDPDTGEYGPPDLTNAEIVLPGDEGGADFMLPLKWCESNRPKDESPESYRRNCIDTRGWISVPRLLFGDRYTDVFGNCPPQTWVTGSQGVGGPIPAGVFIVNDVNVGNGVAASRGSMLAHPSLRTIDLNHIAQVADVERWVSYSVISPDNYEGFLVPSSTYEISEPCWLGEPMGCETNHGCFRSVWAGVLSTLQANSHTDACWNGASRDLYGYEEGSGPWSVPDPTYGGTFQKIRVHFGSGAGLFVFYDNWTTISDGISYPSVDCWDGLFTEYSVARRWFRLSPEFLDPSIAETPSAYLGLARGMQWYVELWIYANADFYFACNMMAGSGSTITFVPPEDPNILAPLPSFSIYARINPPKEEHNGEVWHDAYSPEGTPVYSLPTYAPVTWYNAPCPLGTQVGNASPQRFWYQLSWERPSTYRFASSRLLADRTLCVPIQLGDDIIETLLTHPEWVQFCAEVPPNTVNSGILADPPYMWLTTNQDVYPMTYVGTGLGNNYGGTGSVFATIRRIFGVPKGTYGLGRFPDPNVYPKESNQ